MVTIDDFRKLPGDQKTNAEKGSKIDDDESEKCAGIANLVRKDGNEADEHSQPDHGNCDQGRQKPAEDRSLLVLLFLLRSWARAIAEVKAVVYLLPHRYNT